MKPLIILFAVIASTASARAESWACAFNYGSNNPPTLIRFQLAPPDLIETSHGDHYRLLQNNEYGLVAVSSFSEIEKDQARPSVGGSLVVIDKATGEFWWSTTMAHPPAVGLNQPVQGRCQKG
jgi:hypothetical protein